MVKYGIPDPGVIIDGSVANKAAAIPQKIPAANNMICSDNTIF